MATRFLHSRQQSQTGAALVEVIIGLFLVLIIVGMVSAAITNYIDARSRLVNEVQKTYLAEEAYEVLRHIRDEDWTTISSLVAGARYQLVVATSSRSIASGVETVLGYERSFTIAPVYRSSTGDVVPASTPGAVIDVDGRIVTIDVYSTQGTTTVTALLTNFLSP